MQSVTSNAVAEITKVIEYTSGRPVRLRIGVDGVISVMESTSITSGNNNIRAIMIYPS